MSAEKLVSFWVVEMIVLMDVRNDVALNRVKYPVCTGLVEIG